MKKLFVTILGAICVVSFTFGYTMPASSISADELDFPVEEHPDLPYTYVSYASLACQYPLGMLQ